MCDADEGDEGSEDDEGVCNKMSAWFDVLS